MGAKYTANRRLRHNFSNEAVGYPASIRTALDGLPFASVHLCPIEGTGLVLTCYGTGTPLRGVDGVSLTACTKHRRQHITGRLQTDALGAVSFIPSPSHLSRLKG